VFSAEPMYAVVSDALSFGIRLEGVLSKTGNSNVQTDSGSINASEINTHLSALATCDYYFNSKNIRPFIGGGAGFYSLQTNVNKEDGALLPDYAQVHTFGFMLRGGTGIGHFKTGVEYNFVSAQSQNIRGYFSVKAGVILGGGRFGIISDNGNF
jgi:hypothetical protein